MDTKLKTEIRGFIISKFRNIGFTNLNFKGEETEQIEGEQFVLNYSLNKDFMGDLVILIGPNNSGKSNILDALECFAKENINNRDKSFVFTNDNERKPVLSLVGITGEKDKKWIWNTNYKFSLDSDNILKYTNENKETFSQPEFDFDRYGDEINPNNYRNFSNFIVMINQFIHQQNIYDSNNNEMNVITVMAKNGWNYQPNNNLNQFKEAVVASFQILLAIEENKDKLAGYNNFITNLKNTTGLSLDNFFKQYNDYKTSIENHKWCKQNYPKIIRYEEKDIKDTDLSCSIDEIDNSDFFVSLFQILDNGTQKIKNIYQTYWENEAMSKLYAESNNYTNNLFKISDYFNKLYCLDSNVYQFKLDLQKNEINFIIIKKSSHGEIGLVLNYQSTGFKWFFNFFFNVFASKKLSSGDIVLMDEPATNLHVKGQEELRKFLKMFAMGNGITFIIATHSPFLVDLDYLDEVRLISICKDNTSKIDNNFTTVNPDDVDSLLPIRESLTTRNSVLLDPNQIVVFVEGAIDYNYLVGMKILFKEFNNFTFLPINGVGRQPKEFEKKIKQLKMIKKYKCVIFLDGDKNGDEFSKIISNKFKTIKTSDLNNEFKTIENLFSKEDVKKFNLYNEEKHKWNKSESISITFKKILLLHPEEVSDETKNNFHEMLNVIKNKIKTKRTKKKKVVGENKTI